MKPYSLCFIIIILSFFYYSCNNELSLKDRAGWCNEMENFIVEPNDEFNSGDEITLIDDSDPTDNEENQKGSDIPKKGRGLGREKYYVCHLPPGNPLNARTLRLPLPALKAHLAHGDYLGECEEEQ